MPRTVQEAILACRRGDSESFGVIYDAYVNGIYRFCLYKTSDVETAEDLTSQVFFKALRSFGSFGGADEDELRPWLYRIARNLVIDSYRTAHPTEDVETVMESSAHATDFLADVEARDTLARVRAYVETLPPDVRDILVLRVWEGLSFAEIADVTGKSVDNCKQIVSRTLRKVRAEFPLALVLLAFFL